MSNPAYAFITKTKDQLQNPSYLTYVYNSATVQNIIVPQLVGMYNVYLKNFLYLYNVSRATPIANNPISFISKKLNQPLNQFDSKTLDGFFNWNIQMNDITFSIYPCMGNLTNKLHLGVISMDGTLDIQTLNPDTLTLPNTNFIGYEFEFEYLGKDVKDIDNFSYQLPKHLSIDSIPRNINILADGSLNYIKVGLCGDYIIEIAMYQFCYPSSTIQDYERIISLTSPQFIYNGATDIATNVSGQYYNGNSILLSANYRNMLFMGPLRIRCRLDGVLCVSVWDLQNNAVLPNTAGTYPIISLHVNFKPAF